VVVGLGMRLMLRPGEWAKIRLGHVRRVEGLVMHCKGASKSGWESEGMCDGMEMVEAGGKDWEGIESEKTSVDVGQRGSGK